MNDGFYKGKIKIHKQVEVGIENQITGCISEVSSGQQWNRPIVNSTVVFRIMRHRDGPSTLEIMFILTSDTMSQNCSPGGLLAINLVLFQHARINILTRTVAYIYCEGWP